MYYFSGNNNNQCKAKRMHILKTFLFHPSHWCHSYISPFPSYYSCKSLGTILSDKIFRQGRGVPRDAILSISLFSAKIKNIVKQVDPGVEFSLCGWLYVYKSPAMDAIQRKLQHNGDRLEKWTLENCFTISKNKAVAMHFFLIKMYGPCFEMGRWPYPICKRSLILWFDVR